MERKLFVICSILFISFFLLTTSNYAATKKEMRIEIDLFEKKLSILEQDNVIKHYPISIGTDLNPTPIGTYKITEKAKAWGSGFGSRWLGLNVPWGIYGIHGTNKPHLIGENVSSGCIRMQNTDVEELFELIAEGVEVHIEGPIMGVGEGEYKNLSVGSKGNLVQLIQERLKGLGLYDGEINGIYGIKTEDAVRKFQLQNNLSVNGVISFREYLLLGLLE